MYVLVGIGYHKLFLEKYFATTISTQFDEDLYAKENGTKTADVGFELIKGRRYISRNKNLPVPVFC